MDNKKIHTNFLQGEELPVNILPIDTAWKDMQQRLDKNQPDKSGVLYNDPGKDKAFRSRIVRGSALLLLLLLTWLIIQQTNKTNGSTSGSTGKSITASKEPGDKLTGENKTDHDHEVPDANDNTLPQLSENSSSENKKELRSTANDRSVGKISLAAPKENDKKRNYKTSSSKKQTGNHSSSKQNIGSNNKKPKKKVSTDRDALAQNYVTNKNILPGDTKKSH